MKVIALEIPDDPSELPAWLEQRMTGLDLAALVAELEVVHSAGAVAEPPGGLDALLGDRQGAVLERGLAALPGETLRRLLVRPRLLLDLQERVLFSGGKHWQRLLDTSEDLRAPFERGRHRLPGITGYSTGEAGGKPRALTLPNARPGRAWSPRLRWGIGLAVAASVLVCALWLSRETPQNVEGASGWGWMRPGALAENLPAAAYLNRLADAAEDWFKKRPDEPAALAKQISEFRKGCDLLIQAEHKPLAAGDRDWLITKCRAWSTTLDTQLAALQAGKPVLEIRDEADRTIRRLIEALRQRAKSLALALGEGERVLVRR